MSLTDTPLGPRSTVLVVDDDPIIVELMTTFLTRKGLAVRSAYDGQQCLATVRQGGSIDVIVLDIMMPDMTGLDVCAALRKLEPTRSIPVIFLTAYDDLQIRLAGAELGASAFLVKPVRGQDLFACIQTHLEASRHPSE